MRGKHRVPLKSKSLRRGLSRIPSQDNTGARGTWAFVVAMYPKAGRLACSLQENAPRPHQDPTGSVSVHLKPRSCQIPTWQGGTWSAGFRLQGRARGGSGLPKAKKRPCRGIPVAVGIVGLHESRVGAISCQDEAWAARMLRHILSTSPSWGWRHDLLSAQPATHQLARATDAAAAFPARQGRKHMENNWALPRWQHAD